MNKRLSMLSKIFLALFIGLILNLTYWQIFAADKLVNNQYNTRSINEELSIERGKILTEDNIVVAESNKQGRIYKRLYPFGKDYAHIVGYYDIRLGRSGIEQGCNQFLLGEDKLDDIKDYIDKISGRGRPGNDVILTINSKIQTATIKAMGGKKGAAVLIDPNNGSILSLVSNPSYDTNNLVDRWRRLTADTNSPLLNRASVGLYPPGSSFKVISASAVIDARKSNPAKVYNAPGVLRIYGGKVTNYGGHSYGNITLENGFVKSVNTVFAKVGLELGQETLVDYCQRFGFGDEPPLELRSKASRVKNPSAIDDLELAWTAIGQAGLLVTPLQMALSGCAVANKGLIYKPHIVKKIRNYDGITVDKTNKKVWKRPIKSKTALQVLKMMRMVVKSGTGTAANITGTSVAGKTGTAEIKGKSPHAWFIGIMPAGKPKYVVVVLVENGGKGGAAAAPIARQILEAALAR